MGAQRQLILCIDGNYFNAFTAKFVIDRVCPSAPITSAAAECFQEAVEFHGLIEIPVSGAIAAHSTSLPELHADPCDRMIVGAALRLDLRIMTPDSLIAGYPDVRTLW